MDRLLCFVAMLGASTTAIAADSFLTGLWRVIVPAVVSGLAGGFLQAAIPFGTSSWSAKAALKMMGVGALVGLIVGLFLSHRWFDGLEDYPKMGLEALCGFLALQILDWVNQLGPKGIAEWLVRRRLPIATSASSPTRPEKETPL